MLDLLHESYTSHILVHICFCMAYRFESSRDTGPERAEEDEAGEADVCMFGEE